MILRIEREIREMSAADDPYLIMAGLCEFHCFAEVGNHNRRAADPRVQRSEAKEEWLV